MSLCVDIEFLQFRVKPREDLLSPVLILSVSCMAVWEPVREETLTVRDHSNINIEQWMMDGGEFCSKDPVLQAICVRAIDSTQLSSFAANIHRENKSLHHILLDYFI